LAADLASDLLRGYSRFVVDCGGDMRVGGPGAEADPYRIEVEHPLTGARMVALRLGSGAVATSGLNVRIWRRHDGGFDHHLLDPTTGEPAWTGLVGVTAVGRTALEAETLAKAALLSGPEGAHEWLSERGGALIHSSGDVEYVGLRQVHPPEIRFRLPNTSNRQGVKP
jgi:thiamine biosynthesis lipoprotein